MNHKTVAVVDNDQGMLRAIERLLKAHGFDVSTFSSAELFLRDRRAGQAACLLLDIHLDGMSGLELGRELARNGSTLPVIFMTAFDSQTSRVEASKAGCVAYLLKPFGAAVLMDAIQKAEARPRP